MYIKVNFYPSIALLLDEGNHFYTVNNSSCSCAKLLFSSLRRNANDERQQICQPPNFKIHLHTLSYIVMPSPLQEYSHHIELLVSVRGSFTYEPVIYHASLPRRKRAAITKPPHPNPDNRLADVRTRFCPTIAIIPPRPYRHIRPAAHQLSQICGEKQYEYLPAIAPDDAALQAPPEPGGRKSPSRLSKTMPRPRLQFFVLEVFRLWDSRCRWSCEGWTHVVSCCIYGPPSGLNRPVRRPGTVVPSDIIAGRTGRHQGRPSRPYTRRTEYRPSSTVIGRLLYIFTRDIVGAAGLNLWSNRV